MDKAINFFNGRLGKKSIKLKYLWIWQLLLIVILGIGVYSLVEVMSWISRFINYVVWGISI